MPAETIEIGDDQVKEEVIKKIQSLGQKNFLDVPTILFEIRPFLTSLSADEKKQVFPALRVYLIEINKLIKIPGEQFPALNRIRQSLDDLLKSSGFSVM